MFKAYMVILFLGADNSIVGSIDGGPGPNVVQCYQAVPLVLEAKKSQIPKDATAFPVCIDIEAARKAVL